MKPHHIVIVGAGFGGVYTARTLARHTHNTNLKITLINKTNYFLFTPLLHEVATGSLTPTSVTEPLSDIFANTDVDIIVGDASIDSGEKLVKVNGKQIPFDFLVIATGAETNYFHVPGAKEYAYPLKTVGDAMRIRERVLQVFEDAHKESDRDKRRAMLSFVVIGAGPTGVELVAEIAEFTRELEKKFHHTKGELSIALVTTDSTILKMLPERLQRITAAYLHSLGVRIMAKKTVTEITPTNIMFHEGPPITAGMAIWTAGVVPIPPKTVSPLSTERGRLLVDSSLRTIGHPHVFALGDVALAVDRTKHGGPVPMLAQAATQAATVVANNIIATIQKEDLVDFRFHTKGLLVSLGEWRAIGTIGPIHISGPFAWFIWRTVYLFKFLSTKKRLRIAFEWTINLFTARDTSKLS